MFRIVTNPPQRLLLVILCGIYSLKIYDLLKRRRRLPPSGWIAFLLVWPGIMADRFRERRAALPIEPARFLAGWARMTVGTGAIVLLAIYAPRLGDQALGLAGVAALLLTIHLGIGDVLPWFLRWMGFDVPLLFDRPWATRTLADFWGRRWNLAFIEMNRRLFLKPLYRRLGPRGSRFAIFALSGLLHELALSFPAGGGWGLPLGYFLLQGVLVEVEERRRIAGRGWTWLCVLAPAPCLFHPAFRQALIIPFFRGMHAALAAHPWGWYLSIALYAAALGNLLVLVASLQVPRRLGWHDDIPKLTRFNQKVFWVYGFYILLSVVGFSVLTWSLHDVLLQGQPAARGLAAFMAIFWTARVIIDIAWYDHRDWPPGNALVAGHALVTTLFAALAATYWVTALPIY